MIATLSKEKSLNITRIGKYYPIQNKNQQIKTDTEMLIDGGWN